MLEVLAKVSQEIPLSPEDLRTLLEIEDETMLKEFFKEAYKIKLKYIGNKVFFRGIIEFSNICAKNCFYCGIRKDNKELKRFRLEEENILKLALWAQKHRYGSIVLQGGELETAENASFIEDVLYKIKAATNNELGITLSLGEQTAEVYKRWFEAGAHRYLLRIESSNPEIYKTLISNGL
jgi:biotin synthase